MIFKRNEKKIVDVNSTLTAEADRLLKESLGEFNAKQSKLQDEGILRLRMLFKAGSVVAEL